MGGGEASLETQTCYARNHAGAITTTGPGKLPTPGTLQEPATH